MTEEKIVNIKKAGEPKKEQLVEKKEMTVYRYLFAYNAIVQEKYGLKDVVNAIKPGAIELELFDKVETTFSVNQHIKKILENEYTKHKLQDPMIPELRFLNVTIYSFQILKEYVREVEVPIEEDKDGKSH